MFEGLFEDLPWWWVVLLAASAMLALVLAVALPVLAMTFLPHRSRRRGKALEDAGDLDGKRLKALQEGPRLEISAWEEADKMPGCPWRFDGCEHLSQALDRIWCSVADCEELEEALNAIKARLQSLRVVRVHDSSPKVHFGIIYTLNTGAELFGGSPLGPEVNVELSPKSAALRRATSTDSFGSQESSSRSAALRRATSTDSFGSQESSSSSLNKARLPKAPPTGSQARLGQGRRALERCISCLDPLYRVHDGFASLLSPIDLPALLSHPDLPGYGSCFYVLPARGLRPLRRDPSLVGFARIDSRCVACFKDCVQGKPSLVYVERTGDHVPDDYHPLAFAADTLVNVTRKAGPASFRPEQDLSEPVVAACQVMAVNAEMDNF